MTTSKELADSRSTNPGARKPKRALVFSGGGARGAYEAGVVQYLVSELPKRLGHPIEFDILCGTSVGAIHACYLAATADMAGDRGSRLVDFWTQMRIEEVIPLSTRDLLRLPARLLGLRGNTEKGGEPPERLYGLLNTEPLERIVVRAIPWRGLRDNIRQGNVEAVCVAATQIASGRVAIFIENRDRKLPMWTRDPMIVPRPTRLLPVHALASAAIPLLFPAVRVGRTYYADGGLRLNTPLAPALRLGADRVLVVSLRQNITRAHEIATTDIDVEDYANPLFLFGKILNALLLDHLDTDLARMHVMNEILSDGTKAFGPDFTDTINAVAIRERGHRFRTIHDLVIRPSRDLGILAGEVLETMPEGRSRSPLLRLAMRGIGDRSSAESDLLSYLLFDGEFLGPLAGLGYLDAKAKEEELAAFFSDEPITDNR
ncbi:MAG: patatin-like phospholipase family protein [Myxococcota bacterium]